MSTLDSYCHNGEGLPVLVADPAVYPSTLRNYKGPLVLTSSVFSPGKIIESFAGPKGDIAAGGSVSVSAFDLARIIGADPIILLGLDLSYSGGKPHFSGSFMEPSGVNGQQQEPSPGYHVDGKSRSEVVL